MTGHPAHGCGDGRRIHWLGGWSLVVSVAQSCPTLCNPTDCSPPGSSVHGILQARILEWIAISFSRGPSQPRDQTHVSYVLLHWQVGSLPLVPPGKVVRWRSCLQNGSRALRNVASALVNSLTSDCFPSCSLNSKYTGHIYSLSNHLVDNSWVPSLSKTLLWVSSN